MTVDSPDFGHLGPMVNATRTELAAAGIADAPEVVLADAGYWHQAQMETHHRRRNRGADPARRRQTQGRPPGLGRRPLRVHAPGARQRPGGELYAKRQGMIEPVFAHTKFNRRMDRFQRRGRSAARSRMAAHHRHPQPAQAPHAPDRGSGRLRAREPGLVFWSETRSRTQPLNGLLLTGCSTGSANDHIPATLRNSLHEKRERTQGTSSGPCLGAIARLSSERSLLWCALVRSGA